jgi:hypothetical protein
MKWTKRSERFLITGVATLLFFPSAMRVMSGNGGGGDDRKISGRSTWQRVVDEPDAIGFGTLDLSIRKDKQTFALRVRNLPGDSMGLFVSDQIVAGTNMGFLISPLQRRGSNQWFASYMGTDGAPFPLPFEDLEDMAGLYLFIATPAGVTNISDCVTNIVDDTTNITDCVTNVFYDAFLFTQVPVLTEKPSLFNLKASESLERAEDSPAPGASGIVQVKFDAKKGRSFFCVRGDRLLAGQVYSLWMSDAPGGEVAANVGEMTAMGRTTRVFKRDTLRGEMLPQLAGTVTNLAGFHFEIRDEFGFLYLEGVVPGLAEDEPD